MGRCDRTRGLFVLALLIGTLVLTGGVLAQEECRQVGDRKVCVQSFSAPSTLLAGEQGELSVTVENVGTEPVEPAVILSTVDPNNETGVFELGRPTLQPGATATLTQPLNATTPGTHGLQISLVEPGTRTRYDVSEPLTVEVRSEPAPGIGGPIDRTEVALVALVFAVGVLVLLASRQRG